MTMYWDEVFWVRNLDGGRWLAGGAVIWWGEDVIRLPLCHDAEDY
jgi:hypothetical protein